MIGVLVIRNFTQLHNVVIRVLTGIIQVFVNRKYTQDQMHDRRIYYSLPHKKYWDG